jgi:hypothetical protein
MPKTFTLPTERGYYRTLWSRGLGFVPVTLYLFHNEDLGGLFFQFVGRDDSHNSLPVPLAMF